VAFEMLSTDEAPDHANGEDKTTKDGGAKVFSSHIIIIILFVYPFSKIGQVFAELQTIY
jgi:hypothetical protein